MSIKAVLQTVDGRQRDEEVIDPNYALARIWPVGDPEFPLLQYIDLYGDTVFNRQQMEQVVKELDILIANASTDEQKEILQRIQALAMRCKKRPHWFLRFVGD